MNPPAFCRRLLVVLALGLAGRAFAQAPNPNVGSNPYAIWDMADLPYFQNVTQGRTVVFSTSVIPGVTIEWQQSQNNAVWTQLAGANVVFSPDGTSVQLRSVGTAMNGLWIHFVARNSSTSFTSRSCYLSVSPAYLPMPVGIATDSQNNLYVTDQTNHVVYQGAITAYSESIPDAEVVFRQAPLAGQSGVTGKADGTGTGATFSQPAGVAFVPGGALVVADGANGTIRKVTLAGVATTLAGDSSNHGNVDAFGVAARFSTPQGIARGSDGSYFVADTANHTIRRVGSDGTVTTFAGVAGSAGWADGTTAARFNRPEGVAVDQSGVVYVADTGNNLIRKIMPDGAVSTLAGIPGVAGAQDGAATQATFNGPVGIAVSYDGAHLWVADTGNSTLRVMHRSNLYYVELLAGQPTVSGLQDGYPGLLDHPRMIAVDNVASANGDGNTVYIADTGNAAIRKFTRLSDSGLQTARLALAGSTDTNPPPTTPPSGSGGTTTGGGTTTASSGSGGGSGGGAVSEEFLAAFGALLLVRRLVCRRAGQGASVTSDLARP